MVLIKLNHIREPCGKGGPILIQTTALPQKVAARQDHGGDPAQQVLFRRFPERADSFGQQGREKKICREPSSPAPECTPVPGRGFQMTQQT